MRGCIYMLTSLNKSSRVYTSLARLIFEQDLLFKIDSFSKRTEPEPSFTS